MDFDFTTETITADTSNLLTIGGPGALELPSGTTISGASPAGVVAGAVRWNTTLTQVEYNDGSAWKNFNGSVTSISVVTANGLAGTVATPTTTPAITLSTTITGVLVGNGTAISAATGSTSFPGYAAGLAGGVAGAIPYQTGPNATSFSLAGTSGQALISGGAGSPTWVNGNITIGTTTVSLGGTSTSLAGVTSLSMAGAINMNANQINNLAMAVTPAGTDAVNVNYLQAAVSGLSWKQAVLASTTGALTSTYANGTAGVGATLTATTNVVLPTFDTISPAVTNRLLVKNQGNSFENGIYVVTSLGVAGVSPWILTRSTDMDTAAEVDGAAVYVQQGGTLADTGWTQTSTMTAIGSGNPITWAQFSGSGSYTAGTGLTLTGNTFSLTNPVALSLGGTNANLTAVNGGAVYSTGSALAITAAGTTGQVLTSNGAAAPTWTTVVNSFQTSLSGLTPSTATTGAVTLAGTLGATSGGTGTSVAPTAGQFLFSSAGTTYAPTTLSSQAVTTFAGGTTGLTPAAATSGAITLAGTLVAVNGGTGINTYAIGDILAANSTTTLSRVADVATGNALISGGVGTLPLWGKIGLTTHVSGVLPIANGGTALSTTPTNGQLLIGNGTNYTLAGITAGTGVSVTNGAGTITIANTGVTSIAGTTNQITASAATGSVTLSTPATFIAPGSIRATTTMTVDGLTANSFLYSGTAGLLTTTTAPTNGQLLIGSTGAAPVAAALTAGSGVSITNAAGSITIAATGSGGTVTSVNVSGGTTGLTTSGGPITGSGTITLAGTLVIANGGTNSSTALSGSSIMISNGTQIVQGAAGTTTTVLHGNAAGAPTYSAVSLTTDVSGILPLANGGSNANLTAVNGAVVYSTGTAMAMSAAGTSGQYLKSNGAAAPTWVTLTNGGLQLYSENPSTPTAPSATGTNAVAIGTGSAASATQAIAFGNGTSASIYGTQAYASGSTATAGDAQRVDAVLRNTISAAGTVELFLDGTGAAQRLILPNNSAWTYWIDVVARRTDATGTYGSWSFQGLIYRDATASTTVVSGNSKTTIARIGNISGAANDPTVTADTTNGSLKITVTGYASNIIRYVATVRLAQVTN